MFTCKFKKNNFNCLIDTEVLHEVTISRIHCRCGDHEHIVKAVQARDPFTIKK